ncbi:MAG: universal stress protein [Thermodesulfobacteriota bacterium]
MFGKILFATSASPACDSAARVAFDMARKYGSRITVFHVLGVPGKGDSTRVFDVRTGEEVDADQEYIEGVHEELRTTYAKQLAEFPSAQIEVAVGVPYREVLRQARKDDVDLIVLGASTRQEGGYYKRGIVGGTLHKVAKNARCPVLTVDRPAASFWGGFSNVLFATDFSKASDSAFQFAQSVTKQVGGELHILNVLELARIGQAAALTQEGIEAKLMEARRKIRAIYGQRAEGMPLTVEVWEGTPYVEIIKYVREKGIDLVVMAHSTREVDPDERPFGSTMEQVIARATCPVISVNRPDKLPQAEGGEAGA